MKDLQFKSAGTDSAVRSPCPGEQLARRASVEELSTQIQLEDLSEEHQRIAEVLGMEKYLKLIELCAGQTVYFPMLDSLRLCARDRKIWRRFTGHNYNQLARDFDLSARQIRKIINKQRRSQYE